MRTLSLVALALLFTGCAAPKAERLHVVLTPLLVAASDELKPGVYETGEVFVSAESVLQPMPSLAVDVSPEVGRDWSALPGPGPLKGMEQMVVETPRVPFTLMTYMNGCEPHQWRYVPSPDDRGLKRLTLIFKRSE